MSDFVNNYSSNILYYFIHGLLAYSIKTFEVRELAVHTVFLVVVLCFLN